MSGACPLYPPKSDIFPSEWHVRFAPKAVIPWPVSNRAQNPLPPNEFDYSSLHPVCLVVRPQTRKDYSGSGQFQTVSNVVTLSAQKALEGLLVATTRLPSRVQE